MNSFKICFGVALLAVSSASTFANEFLRVTEVYSAGSGNGTYASDWFEITNTGSTTVSLAGYTVDDNSQTPAASLFLRGVASLAPGASAVFMETPSMNDDVTKGNAFKAAWFGANVPVDFLLGYYSGSQIGLSTTTDQVNIFNGNTQTSTLFASVRFNAATSGFTFDNTGLLNTVDIPITTLSSVGINGAFLSFNGAEVGSPGAIPEPSTYALIAGLGALGMAAVRRNRVRAA